jgi:hypothetical protein
MNELFERRSLPFYKFGDALYLQKIDTEDWVKYICERFEVTNKSISPSLAEKIAKRVDNHSSYVQQLAWLVWVHTDKIATEENFEGAWQDLLDQNTPLFEKQTENLTMYQLNFLKAIIDGVSKEFTTKNVLEKYNLGTSSSVLNAPLKCIACSRPATASVTYDCVATLSVSDAAFKPILTERSANSLVASFVPTSVVSSPISVEIVSTFPVILSRFPEIVPTSVVSSPRFPETSFTLLVIVSSAALYAVSIASTSDVLA